MCIFFQAEDSIRDIGVTGVQTCALPISPLLVPAHVALVSLVRLDQLAVACHGVLLRWVRHAQRAGDVPVVPRAAGKPRSEERRVGKECRSRWSPHHLKNKPLYFPTYSVT